MISHHGFWVGCVLVLTLGCGSNADKNPSASGGDGGGSGTTAGAEGGGRSGGTSGGASGASTGGSSSGGSGVGGGAGKAAGGSDTGGTSGGAAGAAAAGAGAAGAGTDGTCTNTFGTPELLIPDTPGVLRQSLTVTGDDLELYYEERRDGAAHVMVMKRSDRSAPFGSATELDASIWSWCTPVEDPSLDVSDDGLRLYLTCVDTDTPNGDGGYTSSAIRVADRPTRAAAFSLNPTAVGIANVSLSVSEDELTAFWSDFSESITPRSLMATRTSKAEPFGSPVPVPGLQDNVRNPELANDGLHLFGSIELNDMTYDMVMFTRASPNTSFAPASVDDLVVEHVFDTVDDPSTSVIEGTSHYSPTVSGDCKSLYFMRRTVKSSTTSTSEIFVAKR